MLAAVCIPTFSDAALSWLQELRSAHDPKYFRLVAPHVTLVFPSSALPQASFIAHVASCTQGLNGTMVEFTSAREFRDEIAGLDLVCLVPAAGLDWFVRAHERLYSGPLAAELRRDIPFVPHITIGRFSSSAEAAGVATRIGFERGSLSGRVEAVDVVNVSENLVRHVHRQPLGAG